MEFTLVLHGRFGKTVRNPTIDDLRHAAQELFEPVHEVTKEDAEEHPNSWLEYGYESPGGWSVVTIDAYQSGLVLLTKYADQDDSDPEWDFRLNGVSQVRVIELWSLLNGRDMEKMLLAFKGNL